MTVYDYHYKCTISRGTARKDFFPLQLPAPTPAGNWYQIVYNEFETWQAQEGGISTYTIEVTNSGGFTLALPPREALYAVRKTNNVFDLRAGAVSIARFGPGTCDATESAFSPLYASFNPRTNTVVTSATPIGFV